ncbi:MAG: signal recognition particle-docking protein FtsY [Methanolinea sp.]|nr:signal recognition particle-docking protein FtsY [Methanolinea sp.]
MFEGLRARLQKITGSLENKIEENIEKNTIAPATAVGSVLRPLPEQPKDPGLLERVKVLITDREFFISEKDIEEPLFELHMVLLESDVALPVADEIIRRVREDLTRSRRKVGEQLQGIARSSLRGALLAVLGDGFDLLSYVRNHDRPVKILFTGVNGTGKTTTVAKVASYLKRNGFSVVIGAGDTFRAGAQEQIDVHADRLGIKVISHQQGADPSAVLFDAVQYAQAHKIDVVLADTAGRFHNRANLMSQLEKIRRVMKPDLVVYVDEAVAGNDAVVRAHEFEKTVGADAVILTKADMDTKGGAAVSIAHTIGKPVMFLGTGQGYEDITPFSPVRLVDELLGVQA